ncbi:TIGR02186 family protein [Acuticoccus sp. MNP-M23]|uniref:TIGR02186 family protein n=1 Tax=Acuticoccus sp. MNP-M23 TaxID=3072793 RepID=UPI00281509E7|nr:TIGR02186 family protein [Acuticoccus sp. MNP-M23]WMS40840.1 TIGR02186 family protein [Acuticoccus sp. MNP-M23]
MMAAPADAEQLVVSLSNDLVNISSEFQGANISLFGVIERDATTVSRAGGYEVLVVVNGPPHDVLVQKKARRFGIWINSDGATFKAIPSYYAMLTTAGTEAMVAEWIEALPRQEGVAVPARPVTGRSAVFYNAFTEKQAEQGLHLKRIGAVEKLTRTFFHTNIPIPGVADNGDYQVAIYLLADGVPLDVAQTGFTLAKVGVEQRVFELSRQSPLVYGLAVVVLALVTGYVGGVVFRRN